MYGVALSFSTGGYSPGLVSSQSADTPVASDTAFAAFGEIGFNPAEVFLTQETDSPTSAAKETSSEVHCLRMLLNTAMLVSFRLVMH